MGKITFLLFIFNSTFAAAQITESLKSISSELNSSSPSECASALSSATEKVLMLQEKSNIKDDATTHQNVILKSLFDLRELVRNKASSYSLDCIDKAKSLITASRSLGDMVGIYAENVKQVKSEQIEFQKQIVPLKQNAPGYKTLGESFPEFQSGDLMITKGVSFISSTISKIAQPASVYSHIAFVHRDDQKAQTIESYIGDGVKIYEMDFALKNENARILLLRSKDQPLAKEADRYMYDRVKNSSIQYDYDLDFNDPKKLSCEEIAYEAYHQASRGAVKIPLSLSTVRLRNPEFAESLGLKNGQMMAPADMELDPRFRIITDWTDLRLVRDSWRKDTTMSEIFRWSNELHYNFVNDLSYFGLKVFLGLRLVPFVGEKVSQWLSVSNDAPNSALISLDRIRTVGSILLLELEKQDMDHFHRTGLWMSQRQLQQSLESFRKKDRHDYVDPNSKSVFHQYFRENNLTSQ